LSSARIATSLDAAVADCVWVIGTTSRRVPGKRRINPRQAATQIVSRSVYGPVAIVFGDERNGMSNAELRRCNALSAPPTSPLQPSINLAQAVLLYAYEMRMASLSDASSEASDVPMASVSTASNEPSEVRMASPSSASSEAFAVSEASVSNEPPEASEVRMAT